MLASSGIRIYDSITKIEPTHYSRNGGLYRYLVCRVDKYCLEKEGLK